MTALSAYLKGKLASDTHVAQLPVEKQEEHKANEKSKDPHPGCMLSGFLLVNRCVLFLLCPACALTPDAMRPDPTLSLMC